MSTFAEWAQTLAGGDVSAHNAHLQADNMTRVFEGTTIRTVNEFIADSGRRLEAWTQGQATRNTRTPKTLKNYLSAAMSFVDFLQIKGFRGLEATRATTTHIRAGLRRRVRAQEAATAIRNAGRWSWWWTGALPNLSSA